MTLGQSQQEYLISILNAPTALPPFARIGFMPHKAEVAEFAALAQRLCAAINLSARKNRPHLLPQTQEMRPTHQLLIFPALLHPHAARVPTIAKKESISRFSRNTSHPAFS